MKFLHKKQWVFSSNMTEVTAPENVNDCVTIFKVQEAGQEGDSLLQDTYTYSHVKTYC